MPPPSSSLCGQRPSPPPVGRWWSTPPLWLEEMADGDDGLHLPCRRPNFQHPLVVVKDLL